MPGAVKRLEANAARVLDVDLVERQLRRFDRLAGGLAQRAGEGRVIKREFALAGDGVHEDELSHVAAEVVAVPESLVPVEPVWLDLGVRDLAAGHGAEVAGPVVIFLRALGEGRFGGGQDS